MTVRVLARSVFGLVVMGLVIFLSAGTISWPQAWIFLALFIGCSVAIAIWLGRANPALLAERMKSPLDAAQTPYDRTIMAILLVAFWGWFAFMALDARRFGWSHVPVWTGWFGAMLILIAFAGWTEVLRLNSFASVTVRLQAERKQTVVSTGLYGIVRHPMYSFAIVLMTGVPLLLGSLWGLLGLVIFIPLFAFRAISEEAMLVDGLAGYRDYAARVRYRLVPGIW